MEVVFENQDTANKPINVRAKQQISYRVACFPFACV